MAKTRELRVASGRPATGTGRRAVLKGLVTGAGAGLALPGLAASHPMAEHVHHPERMAMARARAQDAPTTPEFLDPHQLATLETLSEAILPGAAAAGCARFIDSLLAVAEGEDPLRSQSPRAEDRGDVRQQFLSALGAIDARARQRFSSPWTGLSDRQRTELLEEISQERAGREPLYWTPGTSVADYLARVKEPVTDTLRDQFDLVKGWVVGAYYSSEVGMRELGYAGPVFAESFPGCSHPDGHR